MLKKIKKTLRTSVSVCRCIIKEMPFYQFDMRILQSAIGVSPLVVPGGVHKTTHLGNCLNKALKTCADTQTSTK